MIFRLTWAILTGLVLLGGAARGRAEAFKPVSDSQVVERLRTTPLAAEDRELRRLRARLREHPDDPRLALDVAWRLAAKGRREADPRFLGQSLAVLEHWTNLTNPPPEVLVLRGSIRQSLHQFDDALADLNLALKADPQNAQALLIKATIHTLRGEFGPARRACLRLMLLTDELTALTASATISSVTGQARGSCSILGAMLARGATAPLGVRLWATTLLAETTARLGSADEAERWFKEALAMDPRDPYLLAARADFLLERHRPAEVVSLLASFERVDPLLLRLAEARRALGQAAEAARLVEMLQQRFDAARLRGESVHLREEARFSLRLRGRPAAALELAQRNWLVQKEPADLSLLLETARAAGDAAAERQALDWVRDTRLEGAALAKSTP